MKVLCSDGVERTFTQRGKIPTDGFVRYYSAAQGRELTVAGFVEGGQFYTYTYGRNYDAIPNRYVTQHDTVTA